MRRLAMLVVLLAGCFETTEGPSQEQIQAAMQKCNTFVLTLCQKSVQCDGFGSFQPLIDKCLSDVRTQVDCGKAISVDEQAYPRCLQEIPASSCSTIKSALPASCVGVIKVKK